MSRFNPAILSIFNLLLSSGHFLDCLKQAIIQILLKKNNLNQLVLSNYRPISKLCFLIHSFREIHCFTVPVFYEFYLCF